MPERVTKDSVLNDLALASSHLLEEMGALAPRSDAWRTLHSTLQAAGHYLEDESHAMVTQRCLKFLEAKNAILFDE